MFFSIFLLVFVVNSHSNAPDKDMEEQNPEIGGNNNDNDEDNNINTNNESI